MKKTLMIVICIILTVGVLLSGCQQESENSGETSDQISTGTQETEEKAEAVEPIKIGVSIPVTGNMAEYGTQLKEAATITINAINEAGGIQGRPVELVIMDSKGDAKESTDIARVFTQDDEILAVIGDFTSTCSMAAAPVYQDAGLVQVSPTSSHADFAPMGDYIFGTIGMQSGESKYMAKGTISKYMGLDSVAVIYLNNDWGVLAMAAFEEGAAESGLEITKKEAFVAGETDFSSVLSKLRQTNPEGLAIFAQYNEAATITNQVIQMGWEIPVIIAGSSCTEQYIQLVGEDSEGIMSQVPFMFDKDNEEQMKFYNLFEERVGFPPTVFGATMHDTVELLCAAMNASPELTRDSIRDTLASYKEYSGIMGPIIFTEVGAVERDYRIGIVEDGAWIPITDYGYLDE